MSELNSKSAKANTAIQEGNMQTAKAEPVVEPTEDAWGVRPGRKKPIEPVRDRGHNQRYSPWGKSQFQHKP